MTKKVKEECRALWKSCFEDSEAYMDYYFKEKCKDNEILVDTENNHVVSMVHLNPYELMWQGKKIKSYYIVGVATEEVFRKQGRMRKLLEQAFSEMRQERIPFTFLMPANKRIYEPFTFQTIYRQERILLKGIEVSLMKAAELGRDNKSIQMKELVELSDREWQELIAYCDKKLSDEFDVYVVRDEKYYRDLQSEMEAMQGKVMVFQNQNNEMAGVLSFGSENGYLEVIEALIDTSFTKEILERLMEQNLVKDKSQISFYESYFLDKEILKTIGAELKCTCKETIMAKVLDDKLTFESAFNEQRVYINELV